MARHIAVGIDVGTSQVKVVIAEEVQEGLHSLPKIIGTGIAEAKGLSRGFVVNPAEVAQSIDQAVKRAEKIAGLKVKRAFVSIGGVGLGSTSTTGSAIISRADLEITEHDIELALEAAEAAIPQAATINRKIINTIPIEYKIDGKVVWGRVEGLKAQKIEVKALFLTCIAHHIEDLIKAVEMAGIEVVDVVAAPIAASFVTLTKKERKVGCALLNLGAETLSLVVFENNTPVSLEIFPIGAGDITNDLALGLKVPLEEAESIKLGSITRSTYSKKKLDEIIYARLGDCFELVETHLKKIGRNGLLPAGAVITGGGSSTVGIKAAAEDALGLPAHIAEIHLGEGEKNKVRDPLWATAYGLAILGFNTSDSGSIVGTKSTAVLKESGKRWFRKLGGWISQFLP